MKPIRQHS